MPQRIDFNYLTGADLEVVIVSWNTVTFLRECLKSLFRELNAAEVRSRVVVVDNASQDGTPEMLQTEFPEVLLVANSHNHGFAKANNQALEQSHSRMVLFLNPDTVVLPGMVQSLVSHLEKNPQAAAVGPRVLNPDGSCQPSASPFPTLSREAWRLFHLDSLVPFSKYSNSYFQSEQPKKTDVLLGACILVRRVVLDQVGSFDEQFFVYSEEVDLCMRIHKAGWEIHWLPDAELIHHGGASTQQVSEEMFLELYRNKVRLFRKYHSAAYAQIYKGILWLASAARILTFVTYFRLKSTKDQKRGISLDQYKKLIQALPSL